VLARYRYDAFGRRVEKSIPVSRNRAQVTQYYYSGLRLIEERDGRDAVQATYTYGSYIDEPLTMDRGGKRFYYHSNKQFSTYALTNSAGQLVERYSYTPYGQVTTFDAAYQNPGFISRVGNSVTFTARELDAETGLMHFRSRTYDTVQGRFKQRDPIGYADGMSMYAAYFVPNNLDALGLKAAECQTTQVNVDIQPKKKIGAGRGFWTGLDFEVTLQFRGQYKKCKTCCAGQEKWQHEVQFQGSGTAQATSTFNTVVWFIPITGTIQGHGYAAVSGYGTYDECTGAVAGGGSIEGGLGLEASIGVGHSLLLSAGVYGSGNIGVNGKIYAAGKSLYASANYTWDISVGVYVEGIGLFGNRWRVSQSLLQVSGGDVLFGDKAFITFN
jgi:RHS repeat-associated protein